MPTEAETRRRKKQDATRKRVALWLEAGDESALAAITKKERLPSRIATLRWLIELHGRLPLRRRKRDV